MPATLQTRALAPLGTILALCAFEPARSEEEEDTLTAELTYTGEVWRNMHGGIKEGTRYLDNADLIISAQQRDLPLLGKTDLHFYVLYNNSKRLTDDLVGDLQGVSNIDAPRHVRVYEAWLQKSFGASEASWRFGLYDLNSEFDAIETAGLFINSSHGIGPDFSQSGANGPSIFPVTALSLRAELPLGERLKTRFAVLDAVPGDPDSFGSQSAFRLRSEEGALLVGELDAQLTEAARVFAGGWLYTKEAPTLLSELQPGSEARARASGVYAAVDTAINDNMRAFARVGTASEAVHPIGEYIGAGVSWEPAFARDSVFGLALAHARIGDRYEQLIEAQGGGLKSAETTLEATMRFELPRGLALQPDVQYVLDPGADPALDDALLVGVRFEWTLKIF